MDGQDWALLRACLAPNVHVDYSDLRGDPPATIAADDFVAAVTGLRGLRTQHLSTNHLVTLDEDRATCESSFLIHRLDPARAQGENTFDTAGHYVHDLRRTRAGWQIDRIKQTVLWSHGNPRVHGGLREPPRARAPASGPIPGEA